MAERKISPYLNIHKIYKKVIYINSYILGGYDPDASAYFARMTVQPASGLKALLNAEILAMKAAGIWTELDCFVFMNLHTEQASCLDIKNKKDHVHIGTNTFTAKVGMTTGGTSSNYINTQFIPSSIGVKYIQDNAGVYFNSTMSGSGMDGVNVNAFKCRLASGSGYTPYNTFNCGTNMSFAFASGTNFLVRPDSTHVIRRVSGSETSMLNNSNGLPTGSWYIGGDNEGSPLNCHVDTYKQYGFGSAMDLTKRNALEAIMADFNSKVGSSY